jgi:hypothetical protein
MCVHTPIESRKSLAGTAVPALAVAPHANAADATSPTVHRRRVALDGRISPSTPWFPSPHVIVVMTTFPRFRAIS